MTKMMLRQRRQSLGELHHRLMREAGQHRMLQSVELIFERRIDARVRMTKEIHPPRTHRIQITPACMVHQPRALALTDRDQWQGLVMLHLRAGMPDTGKTAGDPVGIDGVALVHAAVIHERAGMLYIRNTPKRVSGIGAFSDADRPSASTVRVSAGSMMPSSHSRALA